MLCESWVIQKSDTKFFNERYEVYFLQIIRGRTKNQCCETIENDENDFLPACFTYWRFCNINSQQVSAFYAQNSRTILNQFPPTAKPIMYSSTSVFLRINLNN